MITVPESVLARFRAFSLYNSPYRAHDDGSAIDLYPDLGSSGPEVRSPVSGTVTAIERVRAPPKHYAPEHDYLVAIDTGAVDSDVWDSTAADPGPAYRTEDGEAPIARILHVDPTVASGVSEGDRIAVGDSLGESIRAGFFAPWVDRHLHLGFRRPGDDVRRASGSLPISPAVHVEPVQWDGRGIVVETAETYAVLDRPRHPDPGGRFAAIAGTIETAESADQLVPIDGGLPHYDRGGMLAGTDDGDAPLSLLGGRIGSAIGRTVGWTDPTVTVDGISIRGLSLAATRGDLGAKLICPELSLSPGDDVGVAIE